MVNTDVRGHDQHKWEHHHKWSPCAFRYISVYSPFVSHFSKMLMQCRSMQSILSFTRSMQKTTKKILKFWDTNDKNKIQDDQVSQCIVFWTWVRFLLNPERIKWWGKWKFTAAFCDLPHFAGQYLTLACKDGGDPLWYQPSSEWAAPVAGTGRCCITWRS